MLKPARSPTLVEAVAPVFVAILIAMIVVLAFGASMSGTVRFWIGPVIIVSGGAIGFFWRRSRQARSADDETGQN